MLPKDPPIDAAKARLPAELRWLFPEVDIAILDVEQDQAFVLARVLERGRLSDVRWAMRRYGDAGILDFLRYAGSVELSARTICFWRAYFGAENETWKRPPFWRRNNAAHWPS